MKILQLHNKVPYPPIDGGAIGVWNFTLEFARQGHDVTLLAMNTKKHYCDIKSIPDEIRKMIKIMAVRVDAPITRTGAFKNLLFSRLPYNAQRFVSDDYKNKLIEVLKNNTFDVILLEGLYMSPYLPVIRKYSKAMVTLKAHNVEHEIWQRVATNEPNYLRKKYLKLLARRIKSMEEGTINKNDALITFTGRDASFFNSAGNTLPFYVAPAGIDTSKLVPDRSNITFPSLFFLGALDWAPNQEGLMWFINKVWKKLSDKIPGVYLEVAGRNAPQWLIRNLESEERIKFYGEVPDAYAFMNQRAVMIVPLLSGSGMRIKIIEGMALGKSVVTTSIGTEGINTTHNQDIMIADTAESFMKAAERLLQDKRLCETIGLNAGRFIKNSYDISRISKNLIEFFEQRMKQKVN